MEGQTKLEMRTLSGQDLFPMLKILSKVKVKDMILEYLKKREEAAKSKSKITEEEAKAIGMELFANVADMALCNMDNAKDEINKLLADLCGTDVKAIKELNMIDYTTLVMDFFSKEELSDFFTCIASSKVFQNSR